jgi:cell division inhibitor SepF
MIKHKIGELKMGVLDKFLDIMKLNDDDYEDEFFDDEYEDEYEEKPAKKNFLSRIKDRFDSDDEYDDYDDRPAKSNSTALSNKVTPMRQPARRASVSMEVCVIKPTSVEDSREITETLISGRTVILNLEGLDLEVAQRIIDFTSGAAFAIRGNLQKISHYIFLVTPTNVDISGDLQDLLGTSFDASSMNNRF